MVVIVNSTYPQLQSWVCELFSLTAFQRRQQINYRELRYDCTHVK